jgi:hypothetical protein
MLCKRVEENCPWYRAPRATGFASEAYDVERRARHKYLAPGTRLESISPVSSYASLVYVGYIVDPGSSKRAGLFDFRWL